jgi:1-acyl-sn-glycerol-3-phosphate acyltransferase
MANAKTSPLDSLPPLNELIAQYDQAAQELLQVACRDGHFADSDAATVVWPASGTEDDTPVEALARRSQLVNTIYIGIPTRRDQRLGEAYTEYCKALPAYHRANRLFLQVRRQFLQDPENSEPDFLQLYQTVYLEALGREDPFPLDEGEAALVQLKVARAPLAHAQAVAGKLASPTIDDPCWNESYTYNLDGQQQSAPLQVLLRRISEEVVDALAAGELLAVRYNTFNNFIWFGISVWKAVSEVDELAARLSGQVRPAWSKDLKEYVLLAKGMLLKFLQAHSEDPAQIRPKEYWYGQEYSYLTRDMIDLVRRLVQQANNLRQQAKGDAAALAEIEIPLLLRGAAVGRFNEYPHVGRQQILSTWDRRWRLLKWVRLFRHTGRRKKVLLQSNLDEKTRLAEAWRNNTAWGQGTLDLFGIKVRVRIDPDFASIAQELDLARPGRKIVFFPTHQGLLDHPVMYQVLQSPELMQAMGWTQPVVCTQLARAGLMDPTSIKIGSQKLSLIGVSPELADRLFEEVDGYVILSRQSQDTSSPTRRFAKVLEERPGIVYGAGTTSAFELQVLPMQHALFAHLPQDIVLIPMAFRGSHAIWPKSPKGNMNLNPGLVEVMVCPPMLGETTLLPRKRALRTQLEPATFFQAVHIAALLNPEPSETAS